jgi:DNA invertase Pin-like site-specific DNA recombinase
MAIAYSYLRFSSPEQAKGDSIRRQTEATAAWCQRHKVQLDTSLSLRDEGVSAFRGKHRTNPDEHALAAFLQLVKSGRVPEGSYLVLENLDRLTRESIVPAVNLFTGILLAGVRVVQLSPVEQVFTAGADITSIMLALVELSRGHSESKMKSERVGGAWRQKKRCAADRALTSKVPGWIAVTDVIRDARGRFVDATFKLIPERATTVRRIYDLALAGYGGRTIARTLNDEGVPVLGRTTFKGRPVVWADTTIRFLLTTRAVLGEYQPCRGPGQTPDGDPVAGYYPAVIDPETFHAVQGALATRNRVGRGRRGKHVNLFSGLLRDARDGGHLAYNHVNGRPPTLFPSRAAHAGAAGWTSYRADVFEQAVLSKLREVNAADVFPDGGGAARKVEAAAARLAEVEGLIGKWRAKMDDAAIVDTVAAKLGELEGKRKALADDLAKARQEASSPLSETWGAFRSLADLLAADDGPELRERVRSALRRAVETITCLFVGVGLVRLAAVRVQFRGGDAHRDYLIVYVPGKSNKYVRRPGQLLPVMTFAAAEAAGLDLRKRKDAAKVARLLQSLDLSSLKE